MNYKILKNGVEVDELELKKASDEAFCNLLDDKIDSWVECFIPEKFMNNGDVFEVASDNEQMNNELKNTRTLEDANKIIKKYLKTF